MGNAEVGMRKGEFGGGNGDYMEILDSRFPGETVKKIQFILLILSDKKYLKESIPY